MEGTRLWKRGEPTPWVGADRLDPRRVDLNVQPQLYNLDAVAYESILLGLFSIWRGQPTDRGKPNEVVLGFSRDGFHWDRPSRRAFIPVSERYGDWNWSNVQSAGGGCLARSIPLHTDSTLQEVKWQGAADLAAFAGKPVKFRFRLGHAHLYSFWVSPDHSGASRGYVAAGGPGFTGPIDTAGTAAYANCCRPLVW